MNYRQYPLSLQISVLVSLCLLGGVLMYGAIQATQQEGISNQQKGREVDALAANLSVSVLFPLLNNDLANIENLLLKSTSFPDMEKLFVTDENGNILSEVVRVEDEFQPSFRSASVTLPDESRSVVIYGKVAVATWRPVMLGGTIRGWVYVEANKLYLDSAIAKIWQQSIVAGVAIFFLCFFVIQVFLGRRMKSLSEAQKFAKSLYRSRGQQIGIEMGSRDLQSLAESLNWVSRRLEEQEKRILERGKELERANTRLHERIKELNCIYTLSRVLSEPGSDLKRKMIAIADLIPPSWQFPEYASARIIYKEKEYLSRYFKQSAFRQSSSVCVDGELVGSIEVYYSHDVGVFDEGPFLKEERSLIDEIAGRLSNFLKRYETAEELRLSHENLERRVKERTQELEIAKEEAVFASKAKSDFLSRMSHELRTPMNAILGFTELVKVEDRHGGLSEQQYEFVEEVLKAGKHLLALINEVLDLSQIESNAYQFEIVDLSLSKVTKDILSMMVPVAAAKKVNLTVDLHEKDLSIQVDELKFKQILINLIGNAIKYNKENGDVSVSFEKLPHRKIKLVVKDTGIGMPSQYIHRIFEPFERLGQERNVDGTGIGLAVTRNLVQRMGGDIGVESVEGQGSEFWVIFDQGLADVKVEV